VSTNRAPEAPRSPKYGVLGTNSGAEAGIEGVFQQAGAFCELRLYRVLRSPCGSVPMAVLPTGRVGYASPAVGSGVRGEVLSWSPRYGDGTARPAAYTGGEVPQCRQRKERRVDDGGGFVSLRFRELRDRLSARGSHGVQLLNVPALRRPVGLLFTAAGARVAPRSAHRRLPVGQQILRVPPLPQLRLRLALGRHGSQARPDGSERTPHGPGGPRRCPRAPPRRRRHRSVHRLTICGEVANNVLIALFIQVRVRPVLLISRAHKY
jgi:hypothetical protein